MAKTVGDLWAARLSDTRRAKKTGKPFGLPVQSCQSDGALNLVGTQTSCTDVNMARRTVNNRLHALDIGLPRPVGTSMGVRDLDPKRNALAANIALSHWLHLLATSKF